jgi:hypothetical protein
MGDGYPHLGFSIILIVTLHRCIYCMFEVSLRRLQQSNTAHSKSSANATQNDKNVVDSSTIEHVIRNALFYRLPVNVAATRIDTFIRRYADIG